MALSKRTLFFCGDNKAKCKIAVSSAHREISKSLHVQLPQNDKNYM